MNDNQRERYVRWQNHRITQQSFTINLFLTFAVASLAYIINLKISGNSLNNLEINKVINIWSWSAVFGCVATISKLLDYRHTARKIKDGGKFNSFTAKYCGLVTWGSMWAQIGSYALGAQMFLSAVNA